MLCNALITLFNYIVSGLCAIFKGLISLLPSSPFDFVVSLENKYISWLNYVIPVSEIIAILEGWTLCIGTFYLYRIVLRWIKAIE